MHPPSCSLCVASYLYICMHSSQSTLPICSWGGLSTSSLDLVYLLFNVFSLVMLKVKDIFYCEDLMDQVQCTQVLFAIQSHLSRKKVHHRNSAPSMGFYFSLQLGLLQICIHCTSLCQIHRFWLRNE